MVEPKDGKDGSETITTAESSPSEATATTTNSEAASKKESPSSVSSSSPSSSHPPEASAASRSSAIATGTSSEEAARASASGAAAAPPASPHPSHPRYFPYPPPPIAHVHSPPPHTAHGVAPYEGGPLPYAAAQYDRKPILPPALTYPRQASSSGSPPAGRDPPPTRAAGPPYPPHMTPGAESRYYARAPSAGAPYGPTQWSDAGAAPSYRYFRDYPKTGGAIGPYRFSDPTLRREAEERAVQAGYGKLQSRNPGAMRDELERREGATSPSQIESMHKEEVTTMGCTCKKTKCLKLYCQCFAVKIYCGEICRCMVCKNNSNFESERKEAIRLILSRNPGAFDVKFKKDQETSPNGKAKGISQESEETASTTLAHKLGCKCRKSACMKKYCECYAGSVKCSPNCRCVGCKNMPHPKGITQFVTGPAIAGPRPMGNPHPMMATPGAPPIHAKKQEPWMMNAAQNLAFLKHASPGPEKHEPRRTHSSDNEGGSMPSLASEGSPVEKAVPNTEYVKKKAVAVAGSLNMPEPTSSEKTAVSALLMAAMAMTEMGSKEENCSTPPAPKGSPEVRESSEEMAMDTCETPQKNLLGQFTKTAGGTPGGTPKRKHDVNEPTGSSEDNSPSSDVEKMTSVSAEGVDDGGSSTLSDEESPKREHPGETPNTQQHKVKRSRLGSLRKGARVLKHAMAKDHPDLATPSEKHNDAMVTETPQAKSRPNSKEAELTPVSARCIDFRKMQVNETTASRN